MTSRQIDRGNHLIHHFVGGKWNVGRWTVGGHWQHLGHQFQTKARAELECTKVNKWEKESPKWTVVPKVPDHVLHYHDSWDLLMAVVDKIESFHLLVSISSDSSFITSRGVEDELIPWLPEFPESEFYESESWGPEAKLTNTWKLCIAFIKWYIAKTS